MVSPLTVSEKIITKERPRTPGIPPRKQSNAATMIIGILILLLIVVGIARMVMSRPDPAAVNRRKVAAAAEDILPGTKIGFAMVRYVDLPKEYVDDSMFEKTNLVVGRVSKHFIPAMNPISKTLLFAAGQTLSNQVENHERAITLKLSEEAMVDNQLFPDDKVDVLATVTKDGKRYTKTLGQEIRVLSCVTKAMLESKSVRGGSKNRVTLAVAPDMAELLTEAEQAGTIKLVLRNRLAVVQEHLRGVGENDLIPRGPLEDDTTGSALPSGSPAMLSAIAVPEPPPISEVPAEPGLAAALPAIQDPVKWVVEVFSGSKKETYAFPATGQ